MQSCTLRDIQKRIYQNRLDKIARGEILGEAGSADEICERMDRQNALEERREIRAATKEVWEQ